jgi:sugar lactone lactonase YvrE
MKRFVILGFLSFLPAGAQIVVGPPTLPPGQVNTPYSQQLAASGGTGPYTFALYSGSLPSGTPAFSIGNAGAISGTPDGCASFAGNIGPCPDATEPINSAFTVLATDSLGATGTQTYTLGIYWNPTEASFLTTFAGYDANLLVGVSNPPPLLFGAHLTPANPIFRQPATDNQAAWNAWVDGIHAAGATILNIEPDLDCVVNNLTSCLALYSGAISHAHSIGMSVSLNPEYSPWPACGGAGCSPPGPSTGSAADCQAVIGHAVNASPGTGVSDWFACLTTPIPALGMSAYQWMISNWLANGDRFVPVHEPTTMTARWYEGAGPGGCSTAAQPPVSAADCNGLTTTYPGPSGNTCPNDWWSNFVQPLLNPTNGLVYAWASAAGIGIRTAVTDVRGEIGYSTLFSENLPAGVDLGFDAYSFTPSAVTEIEANIWAAQQNHHQTFFEEFAAQRWVQSGSPENEQCAIKGCYSCDWQASQSDQNFVAAFLPFAAAHGALSASWFPSQAFAGCSPTYPDNCQNFSVIAAACAAFLRGNSSALSQKLASILMPGGNAPAAITITAGDGQSASLGQAFPTALSVSVTGTSGAPVAGASVTFTVTPGPSGASGVFSWTGPVTIATDLNGNATAPVLTANSVPGEFTVTATVNALTAIFTLANAGETLGASSTTVGSAAGFGTVLLSGAGPWSAASNTSWLHIAAGSASGTGDALIQFSYDANTIPNVQTGTLTIAGLTFTVTQAGASYVPVYPVTVLAVPGLNLPQAVAVDTQGNVYIADTANNAVKRWNAATGQVTVLVTGLNAPAGVAVDGQGNVYIADTGNNAIREWIAGTQQVRTLVSSALNGPTGVAVDALGNVYIADSGNQAVEEWNAASGQVSVLVNSVIETPTAVAVDALGNVYIADSANNAVFEWNVTGGQATTLVSGLSAPAGVAVDGQGNVYIADTGHNALKQWNAATQQVTVLISSGLTGPAGLAVDGSGNVYLAGTGDSLVKKLSFAYLALGSPASNESAAGGTDSVAALVLPPSTPVSAASDQPWLTVASLTGGTLSFSFTANTSALSRTGHITVLGPQVTVVQNGDVAAAMTKSAGDGQITALGQPFPVALAVTVTDGNGNPVAGAPVTFSAIPGESGASASFASAPPMPIASGQNGIATAPVLTANNISGQFTASATVSGLTVTFNLTNAAYTLESSSLTVGSSAGGNSVILVAGGPWSAVSDSSWLHLGVSGGTGGALIAFNYDANQDAGPRTGTLTISGLTFTVTQAGASYTAVTLLSALVPSGLKAPRQVAVDGQGNIYIADTGNNAIREWLAATQQAITLVSSGLNIPSGVAVDALGNVYIADTKDNAIKEWTAATQQVTTLVLSGLLSPAAVAVDGNGDVFFSDTGHNSIKEWAAASGQVTTLVSGLNRPDGVAVDALGNVYFADTNNNEIKEWNAAGNSVTVLVSTGLNSPRGVAVDGDGNVYIADSGNNAIKQWNPATGQVTTLVSSGLRNPGGLAVAGPGGLYVADTGGNSVQQAAMLYVALGSASLTETASAGDDSVTVQVLPPNTPLKAASNAPWLTITGTTGGAIAFSFTGDTSVNSRVAYISALGLQVSVTQAGDTPATIAQIAGYNQRTPVNQPFRTNLKVRVEDATGNPVRGAAVTFTVNPGSNGSGGSFGSSPAILTNAAGYAAAPPLTANGIPGAFTVTASTGGLSATFTLTITE